MQRKKCTYETKHEAVIKRKRKDNFITSIAVPPLNRLYRRRSTTHGKENRYAPMHIKVIYDRVAQ